MAMITINGRDIYGTSDVVARIFRTVSAIIESGDHQVLVIDGDDESGPNKELFAITPTSTVLALLDELSESRAAQTSPANLDDLWERYVAAKRAH